MWPINILLRTQRIFNRKIRLKSGVNIDWTKMYGAPPPQPTIWPMAFLMNAFRRVLPQAELDLMQMPTYFSFIYDWHCRICKTVKLNSRLLSTNCVNYTHVSNKSSKTNRSPTTNQFGIHTIICLVSWRTVVPPWRHIVTYHVTRHICVQYNVTWLSMYTPTDFPINFPHKFVWKIKKKYMHSSYLCHSGFLNHKPTYDKAVPVNIIIEQKI